MKAKFLCLGFLIVFLANPFWFEVPPIVLADTSPSAHTFSNPRIANATYYATGYNLVGSTTFVSGSIADLKSDDGTYMTFRSYPSGNGTGVLGSSTASTTGSTTIENQIVGSLFTPTSGGWLSNIMAYIGITTATKLGGAALYRHSDLAWIANTSVVSLTVGTSSRTFTFSQPYPVVVAGTEYILNVWSASGSGNGLLYYGTGVANQGHIDSQTWGAWPKPLVPTTHNAFVYDVNASMITQTEPTEYTCDVEFTGTSDLEDWISLFYAVNSRFTTSDVVTTIQLYSYSASNYPANGDGCLTHNTSTTNLPKNQTITTTPTNFRNTVDSVWKLKIKGVKTTNLPFDFLIDFLDPTVIFTTVNIKSVYTCPLDTHTFVIAYNDGSNNDFSFQIYDTNGTQVLAETDMDTTSSAMMFAVGASAFNNTCFVLGWHDVTDQDATFAIYNVSGSLLVGPVDADTAIGDSSYAVKVSCLNSTYFVIAWFDYVDADATFSVYDSSGTLKTGPIDADEDIGTGSQSVTVSAFNETYFVVGWFDRTDQDMTFSVYDTSGTLISGPIDVDDAVGTASEPACVSTLNSTHFVFGYYDYAEGDATFAVYTSSGTLTVGPIDADTSVGLSACLSVHVAALNSTVFAISWYDNADFDLSYATYYSNGTAITALTDIESWPTAVNAPFRYQSPCSQETANNIKLYGDNWIIAYANTTTQAIWQAFYPNGTAWDGTIPSAGTSLTWLGSAVLTFTTNTLKTWSFSRTGTATLTFLTETIANFVSEQALNFYGSALLTFVSGMSRTFIFNRYGTSTLAFLVESAQNFASVSTLNLYGSASLAFIANVFRTFDLTRHGTASLTFTAESIQNLLRTLSFGGSANLAFLTEQLRTLTFNRYGSATLTFTTETLVQGLGTWLNFFGSAQFTFNVAHWTNLLPSLQVIDYGIVALGFAVIAFALAVTALGTKKEPEKD